MTKQELHNHCNWETVRYLASGKLIDRMVGGPQPGVHTVLPSDIPETGHWKRVTHSEDDSHRIIWR